jgi:hypothetical protein
MSNIYTDRIARPTPERPVEQIKAAENRRAEAADLRQQATRAAQENKASASRQEDKGRYVDRYA